MSPKQFREMFERVVSETEYELQRAVRNQVADIPDFGFAECWGRFCKWNQQIERELAEERDAVNWCRQLANGKGNGDD